MPNFSRKFAADQIGRVLSRLFQPTQAEVTDLVDALMNACETDEHAKTVIGFFVDDPEAKPSVADIRRIAWETRRTEVRALSGCPYCFGSGFRSEERWETVNGVSTPRSYASPCDCKRRQARQEPDTRVDRVQADKNADLAMSVAERRGQW